MFIGTVNYVAILVAALAYMAIGWFWYSPSGFGKQWQALMGIKPDSQKGEEMKAQGQKAMGYAFVAALVMAYVLANIIRLSDTDTISGGMSVGFWTWLGFLATSSLGSILWENKSPKLYYLNNGYSLVGIIIMAVILALWA